RVRTSGARTSRSRPRRRRAGRVNTALDRFVVSAEPGGSVIRDHEDLDFSGVAGPLRDLVAESICLVTANRLPNRLGGLDGLIGASDHPEVEPVLDTVVVDADRDGEPAHRGA